MNDAAPPVSVLTPSSNHAAYLEETIQSVVCQGKRQAYMLYTMWQTYLLLATLPVLFLWKCRRILAVPNYVKKKGLLLEILPVIAVAVLGFAWFIKTKDGFADVI